MASISSLIDGFVFMTGGGAVANAGATAREEAVGAVMVDGDAVDEDEDGILGDAVSMDDARCSSFIASSDWLPPMLGGDIDDGMCVVCCCCRGK